MANLIDPVDAERAPADSGEIGTGNPDALVTGLSPGEVTTVPPGAARTPHPFDGYQLGADVEIWDYERTQKKPSLISRTFLILLQFDNTYQDPSGANITHQLYAKDKVGRDIKPEDADGRFKAPKIAQTRIITLRNFHNRSTVHPITKASQKWIFDRVVADGDRWVPCCVVPSHSARAQLIYKMNPDDGRPMVDDRYQLADGAQIDRLSLLFRRVNWQQTKAARLANSFDREAGGERGAMGAAGADN